MSKLPFRRVNTPPAAPPQEDGDGARMSIFDHLNELRQRLTKAFLGLIVGTLFSLLFTQTAFDVLREPYCRIVDQPAQCQLVTLGPTGGVVAYFRVALMMGAVLSIPLITYQLLMFIFPGLTQREKRFVLSSLPAITLLFLGGVVFSWYILMPPALGFLEGFAPTIFRPEWTADLYLSFVTSLLFWMGVAFQTPLVFFVLSILGLVTAAVLIRNWRIAIVGAAIAAALITPTVDPVNMFIVMGPLLVLYLFSIVLVAIGRRFNTPRA